MNHLTSHEQLEALTDVQTHSAHLAQCPQCAGRLAALHELANALNASQTAEVRVSEECLSTEEIAEYIEGNSADRNAVKAHLASCDACFGAAGYYFAESERMNAADEPRAPEKYIQAALELAPRKSFFQKWVLAPLPAYATALVLLLFMALTPSTPRVVLTRETAFYGIYEKKFNTLPYFYFSEDGERVGSQQAGMRIKSRRGELIFIWNPVPGVDSYYFLLQETVEGSATRIREIKTAVPTLTLPSDDFKPGASYRWIAAGSITESRYFQGRMEFRIAEK
ncbi:MAG: hypothetical protein HZA04_06900 [Nitrospinae bacterium]|nr:hypothetical protein [Nitrospinota bacterium]